MKQLFVGLVMALSLGIGSGIASAQSDVLELIGPGSTIGVSVRELSTTEAGRAAPRPVTGVYVENVANDSPASRAGVKVGDIVVEFDGERVRSVRNFRRLVEETPPSRQVVMVVVRDGRQARLNVQPEAGRALSGAWSPGTPFPQLARPVVPRDLPLRRLPRVERFPAIPVPPPPPADRGRLGVSLQPLTGQMADYFGVDRGALVTSVEPQSPAARAGLKAGDVITGIGSDRVESPADVQDAVRRAGDGEVSVRVMRDRSPLTLNVSR